MNKPLDPQLATTFMLAPSNEPGLVAGAAESGAHCVILDLEDTVPHRAKGRAREMLREFDSSSQALVVRINALGTPWHDDDLAALAGLDIDAVMIPKCEAAGDVASVAKALSRDVQIIALIETAVGIASAREIAASPDVARLAFGSIDFQSDIGCTGHNNALLFARSELVLASRLGGMVGPLDGVTMEIGNANAVLEDTQHVAQLGFTGKICIDASQVEPVHAGFLPKERDLAWARTVVDARRSDGRSLPGSAAATLPALRLAEQILARERSITSH